MTLTLLQRLRVEHQCRFSDEPRFEQIEQPKPAYRVFRCLACGARITLRNKSA